MTHQITCGQCPAMQLPLYSSGRDANHYCEFVRALNTINAKTLCELRACGWTLSDMEAEAKRVRELSQNVGWAVLRRVFAARAEILEAAVRAHVGGEAQS